MLVENFPVALGVCLGVIAAVAAVFVFSMPMVRSPIDEAMLGSAPVRHYSAPRDPSAYERLVGNVLVHYGGRDPGVLARVKATVAALRGA